MKTLLSENTKIKTSSFQLNGFESRACTGGTFPDKSRNQRILKNGK